MLGIVNEGDLVHRVLGDHNLRHSWWLSLIGDPNDVPREYVRSHGKTAKDVMTKAVITAATSTSIANLAALLETNRIKRVPIVSDGKLAGIVSRANIIQALVALEDDQLPEVTASDQKIRAALLQEFDDRAWAHIGGLNLIVKNGVVSYWGVRCVRRRQGRAPRRRRERSRRQGRRGKFERFHHTGELHLNRHGRLTGPTGSPATSKTARG